jgi:peroxiredoxin family protein
MLSEARELGAKVIVCDTTLKLCGLAAADLGKLVDEVMGLAAIWRLTQNARTLSF